MVSHIPGTIALRTRLPAITAALLQVYGAVKDDWIHRGKPGWNKALLDLSSTTN
jgi:hypothetical protein